MTNLVAAKLLSFYCPLEGAIHPQVDEMERRALSWVDAFDFCATPQERAWVRGSRAAEFYARFAPTADVERAWLAAAWTYWGFAFDDARCDEGPYSADPAAFAAMAAGVQRALETPGPAHFDDPYAAALHDLGERFRACAGPARMRRFTHAHRAWLTGVQWQVGNAARGYMPTLDEYLTMRLHSAGGEPTYAMLEIANGTEAPADEMDSPAVLALTEMAILVAALDNDRHSLRKEAPLGQAGQNIFNVLINQHGYSLDRAIDDAVALRDRVLVRFLRLREKTLLSASPPLVRYLEDLGHGIRGNAEWGQQVMRYQSLDHAAETPGHPSAPPALQWADHPADPDPTPIAVPAINWWWNEFP